VNIPAENENHGKFGFVTLLVTDDFLPGAVCLIRSLKAVESAHTVCVMVTRKVGAESRQALEREGAFVAVVDGLKLQDRQLVEVAIPPTMGDYFYTKLRAWQLTQFEKAVYIDSDMVVLENIDDLFSREQLTAAPCQSRPDKFNAGLMVLRPDAETFVDMKSSFSRNLEIKDGDTLGDQGFLNQYFADWYLRSAEYRLPMEYNALREVIVNYPME
jgi:glycogenin glucosyltransferase